MKRRPRYVDAIERAIEGSRLLPKEQRRIVQQGIENILLAFQRGQEPELHWRALVDCHAVAEQLSRDGICSDAASRAKLDNMQTVLGLVWNRWNDGGTWTLHADELALLRDGVEIHSIQLDYTSRREYDSAIAKVANRMKQALAGNVPPGTIVMGKS